MIKTLVSLQMVRGYWFVLSESINVKLEAISSGASLIYTLLYSEPVRNSYRLSPYEGKTRYEANESGSIGIPYLR